MEELNSHVVHLYRAHHPFNWHLLLLFIPAIAFAITIAFVASIQPHQYASSIEEPTVLGDQVPQ